VTLTSFFLDGSILSKDQGVTVLEMVMVMVMQRGRIEITVPLKSLSIVY
jgi:hypothetical protein